MLRSRLSPDDQRNVVEVPTRHEAAANRFALNCWSCGGRFYVDEATLMHVNKLVESGNDSPFVCPECEAEYEEDSRRG